MPALLLAVPLAASTMNNIAIDALAGVGACTIVAFLIYLGYVLGRAHIFDEDPGLAAAPYSEASRETKG